MLDPIDPVLFLPEVVDPSLWFKGKHLYSDPEEKYVFAFSGTADACPIVMRFNTDKLPIEEAKKIDSVWTFLDKRFTGQIAALPPTIAGAGGTYFVAMVHPDIGEKYLRRFYDPELKVAFTEDFRQIADGVAKGKYTMAIFVGSAGRDIDNLAKKGLPVANFSEIVKGQPLKERPVVGGSGASNNIMVANKRPHPNAAKLFLNWFLSKEGQTIMQTMSDRTPDQSFRVDVTERGKVRKADMRKPGVEYLTLEHDPEIQKKRVEEMKRAEDLYLQVRRKIGRSREQRRLPSAIMAELATSAAPQLSVEDPSAQEHGHHGDHPLGARILSYLSRFTDPDSELRSAKDKQRGFKWSHDTNGRRPSRKRRWPFPTSARSAWCFSPMLSGRT